MAAVPEITNVVRKIRPELLEPLFNGKLNLGLTVDWTKFSNRKPADLVQMLEELPEEQGESVYQALGEIAEVGRETKNIATIYGGLELKGVRFDPSVLEGRSAPEVACWVYVNYEDGVWTRVKNMTGIDNLPKGEWKSFGLEFEEEPEPGSAEMKSSELKNAISQAVFQKERRGALCTVDVYSIGSREYTVFKLNDHKTDLDYYDDNNRAQTDKFSLAFEIVFSFDYEEHKLSVIYRSNPPRAKELCKVWADTVFGRDTYRRMKPVRYNIQSFAEHENAELRRDPMSSISAAKVVGLEIQLGSRASRRFYFEQNRDVYATIADELPDRLENRLAASTVKRVHIQITYSTARRSNITKTFSVSETSASNLSNSPTVQKMIRDYMKFLGMERDGDDTPPCSSAT